MNPTLGMERKCSQSSQAGDKKQFIDSCLVTWAWPVALIARIEQESAIEQSEGVDQLLLIAPTAAGLDELESSERSIKSMWVLAFDTEKSEGLTIDQIEEISTWTPRTPDGRQMTVLRSAKRGLIVIEDEEIFSLSKYSVDWPGNGTYRRQG